jgi:hypothetical protein
VPGTKPVSVSSPSHPSATLWGRLRSRAPSIMSKQAVLRKVVESVLAKPGPTAVPPGEVGIMGE